MTKFDAYIYCAKVRSWLPCGWKQKRHIMKKIRHTVAAFLAENPLARYKDIVVRFGTPQKIAGAYVEELNTPELLNQLRFRKRIVKMAFITAFTVAAIFAAGIAAIVIENHLEGEGYAVVTVTYENDPFVQGDK